MNTQMNLSPRGNPKGLLVFILLIFTLVMLSMTHKCKAQATKIRNEKKQYVGKITDTGKIYTERGEYKGKIKGGKVYDNKNHIVGYTESRYVAYRKVNGKK